MHKQICLIKKSFRVAENFRKTDVNKNKIVSIKNESPRRKHRGNFSIILLAFLEKLKTSIKNFFLVFGRTPLFFYLIHVPVIHFLSVMLAVWMGYDTTFQFNNSDPATWPEGFGFNLTGIYAVWIFVVLLLYPLCKWFAKLKAEKKNKWLGYL